MSSHAELAGAIERAQDEATPERYRVPSLAQWAAALRICSWACRLLDADSDGESALAFTKLGVGLDELAAGFAAAGAPGAPEPRGG